MEVVAFLHHLGNLRVLLRSFFGYFKIILHIVVVFHPAAQLLHVLRIIRIVVTGRHRAEPVKAPRQHTLGVHVGKAQRSYDILHALLPAIVLYGLEQGIRHIQVVDEVNPAEAHVLLLPLLVGFVVDDGSHTSDHLPILHGKVILSFAEVKGRIPVFRQRVQLVAVEIGHIVGIALVEIIMELDKSLQVFLRLYSLYLN